MPPRLKLLLVDREPADRHAVREAAVAAELDVEFEEIESPERALELLTANRYDCVVLDSSFPSPDGLSLIDSVRAAGDNTPILVLTGREEDSGTALVAAGATDYLSKSELTPLRLVQRIRYAIRRGDIEGQLSNAASLLARDRRLFLAVLDQLPAGVVVLAPSGEVLLANSTIDRLLWPGAFVGGSLDASGPTVRRLDGTVLSLDEWPVRRALDRIEVIPAEDLIVDDVRGRRYLRVSAAPVLDDSGLLIAAAMTVDDVSLERQARNEALKLAHARENLMAIVSHDLRSPLNAISIAIDELADPSLEPEMRQRYVDAVRRSIGRGDRLIRDLLDATTIEAGKLVIAIQVVSVREFLERFVWEQQMLTEQAKMPLRLEIDGDLGTIRADPYRLHQALTNLLVNALAHAKGSGVIRIIAGRDGSFVSIGIRDRGPGIAAESLPHVFDRFWQARRHDRAGAGLGLAIAKGIAEAHGGSLDVSSVPGEGACFRILLPIDGLQGRTR